MKYMVSSLSVFADPSFIPVLITRITERLYIYCSFNEDLSTSNFKKYLYFVAFHSKNIATVRLMSKTDEKIQFEGKICQALLMTISVGGLKI